VSYNVVYIVHKRSIDQLLKHFNIYLPLHEKQYWLYWNQQIVTLF